MLKELLLQIALFVLITLGLLCFMLAKTRHQQTLAKLLTQYFPTWQREQPYLVKMGNGLLLLSFLLNWVSSYTSYVIVQWFGMVSLSSMIIIVWLMWLDNHKS